MATVLTSWPAVSLSWVQLMASCTVLVGQYETATREGDRSPVRGPRPGEVQLALVHVEQPTLVRAILVAHPKPGGARKLLEMLVASKQERLTIRGRDYCAYIA